MGRIRSRIKKNATIESNIIAILYGVLFLDSCVYNFGAQFSHALASTELFMNFFNRTKSLIFKNGSDSENPMFVQKLLASR